MDSKHDYEAALQQVVARYECEFDEPQALTYLVKVRSAGVLSDGDWDNILEWLDDAMQFLSTESTDSSVLSIDADPRNANWLRIMGAWRLTGYRTPDWATLWLWRIGGTDEDEHFWSELGCIAADMGFEKLT